MPKVLVVYYSRTGNTESMAKSIAEAIAEESLAVECKEVENVDLDELLDVDGLVVGSPTYYGTMAAEIKKFLDDSIKHHGKLDGKVGAAFASAGSTGQETTVISILEALLIHGMVIQGDPRGHHYGVTSLGKPAEQDVQRCNRFGQRFARLVKRVAGE
jgi:NAD(P)H dehydrogenase (quinone)